MATTRDTFLSQLLQGDGKGAGVIKASGGPLVQELGPGGELAAADTNNAPSLPPPPAPADEGPSLMELMMAAHKEAKVEKEATVREAEKKATKSFGDGFKKGFFGGGGSSSGGAKKAPPPPPAKQPDIPTISKPAASAVIPGGGDKGGKPAGATAAITAEVQRAMSEDESPALKQLRQGDWVTQDLVQVFASNAIIAKGLQNPRCQAAMQLMQQDPKAAQQRFQGDPEVDVFMREFGRVMAAHFDALGEKQQPAGTAAAQPVGSSSSSSTKPLIAEASSASSSSSASAAATTMGPLQAQAIERSRAPAASSAAVVPGAAARGADGLTDEERDAARVKDIVADAELSALLLDVNMQRVLQECGDPVLFRRHMADPATAKKIKKLFDAGLVATAK